MASAAADSYGVDVDTPFGVPLRWNLCSGTRNVGNALARRFSTTRGTLKSDLNYGLNLRKYLQGGITSARLSQLRSAIAGEAAKEETVDSVTSVVLSYSAATQFMTLTVQVALATGPFTVVLGISAVTVTVLRQGPGTAAAVGGSTGGALQIPGQSGKDGRDGTPGGAGPAGPVGPAGSGSPIVTLPASGEYHSATGAEALIPGLVFSLDASELAGASLNVSAVMTALSAAGDATIRLRVGGSYTAADGTVVDSQIVSASSFTDLKLSGTITNPTGTVPVKITIASSALETDAAVRAPTVSVSG